MSTYCGWIDIKTDRVNRILKLAALTWRRIFYMAYNDVLISR